MFAKGLTTQKKKPFENIVGKGENAVTSIFSFSHNVFYLSPRIFLFLIIFILSSANAFNLDQSKNLSFSKGLRDKIPHKDQWKNPAVFGTIVTQTPAVFLLFVWACLGKGLPIPTQ